MRAQDIVELERDALQQIAEGDAEDQRRDRAADEQPPVPRVAPARVVDLGAVVETDGPEEQAEQHQQHRHVEARERGAVDHRPGREDRAAGGDEPHLIAVPVGADGIDGDAPFRVVARDEWQQRADAHIHAVGDSEADQQRADHPPPNEFQGLIVEHGSLLIRRGQRRAPGPIRSDSSPRPARSGLGVRI